MKIKEKKKIKPVEAKNEPIILLEMKKELVEKHKQRFRKLKNGIKRI